MDLVLVKNANRMMTTASLLDDGIELSFADGFRGLIPYADVPEVKVRAGISGLELPDPYEMVLQTAEGERVEVSWDFARHYCDASYRPTVEAMAAMGRQALGGRVRRFRGAAGLMSDGPVAEPVCVVTPIRTAGGVVEGNQWFLLSAGDFCVSGGLAVSFGSSVATGGHMPWRLVQEGRPPKRDSRVCKRSCKPIGTPPLNRFPARRSISRLARRPGSGGTSPFIGKTLTSLVSWPRIHLAKMTDGQPTGKHPGYMVKPAKGGTNGQGVG